MAGPADEARQLVDQRAVQLAKLHWALESQATRVEVALRWLDAVEAPTQERLPAAAPAPAIEPAGPPRPPAAHESVVLPPEVLAADGPSTAESAARRLRVIVSESREVSLEVEDKIPAPAPEPGTRYRLAS
jgi:hypothetical protein